jgi:16S rRNA (uracil1498-N3)-methyltransferase
MHRIHTEHLPDTVDDLCGRPLIIDGQEAEHAVKVKRLVSGETVEVLDGRGRVASGTVNGLGGHGKGRRRELIVDVSCIRRVEPVRPIVHVFSATPKGGRVDEMIDQLAQAGAAAWSPLETERGVVEPRETKLERLHRIARESSKQSGRAWDLLLGERTSMPRALDADTSDAALQELGVGTNERAQVIVADGSGEPTRAAELDAWTSSRGVIRLLVGPEGGWTEAELAYAKGAGARVARFGPQIMRIETAAVVAAGVLLSHARST